MTIVEKGVERNQKHNRTQESHKNILSNTWAKESCDISHALKKMYIKDI